MDVLLLTDIAGIGRKNDLLRVADGFALNSLIPGRKAIAATPKVRKQYAAVIKSRAEARERERELQTSISAALGNKVLHLSAKASSAGKLYAAVSPSDISQHLQSEYGFSIPADTIELEEHIKTTGKHTVTLHIGTQAVSITVEVSAAKEEKAS